MENQKVYRLLGKRLTALALSGVLVAASLTGCSNESSAVASASVESEAKETERSDEAVLKDVIEETAGIHTETESGEMTKEETVYVIADANGTPTEIIVSDWLKNPKAEAGLNDITTLKDIQNTSGSELYTEDANGNIRWNANGNDIHYQGKSDKQLPVDVRVTYYLDGVETTPEEIAGKRGNVKIRFDYTNNEKTTINVNGKTEEINIPFAMMSGLILDSAKFSGIKVSNGRVVSEGGRNIVVGVAFPGLSDSLKLNELKDKAGDISENLSDDVNDFEIPEYVEIEAYTTDFTTSQTMSVAITDLLTTLDSTTTSINTDDIKNSMDELKDASVQLTDGAEQLSDGAGKLTSGAKTLSEKSLELNNGAQDLDNGATELANGAGDLNDGAKKLDDGAAELMYGTISLKDGTSSLVDGVNQLKDGTGTLKDGTQQLQQGFEGDKGAVNGASQLASGAKQLNEAVQNAEIPGLTEADKEKISKAGHDGASASEVVSQFAGSIANGIAPKMSASVAASRDGAVAAAQETATAGAEETGKAAATAAETQFKQSFDAKTGAPYEGAANASGQFAEGVKSAVGGALQSDDTKAALKNGLGDPVQQMIAGAIKAYDPTVEEAVAAGVAQQVWGKAGDQIVGGVLTSLGSAISVDSSMFLAGVEEVMMSTAKSTASSTAQSVSVAAAGQTAGSVIDQVSASLGSDDTKASIKQGLIDDGSLAEGLGQLGSTVALTTADSIMTQVAATLTDTMSTLGSATQQLAEGNESLYEGILQLYNGTYKVNQGVGTLYEGVDSLQDGAYKLDGGACALKDGAVSLKNGTAELYDGTVKLKDGTLELKDGTFRLLEGTGKFKDGTKELYDGTVKLSDGTLEMLVGIMQFDEEGISKLTELFGEDVDDVVERLKAVMDAGTEYVIYTEVPEGIDSSVKFIYSTEAIKSEK